MFCAKVEPLDKLSIEEMVLDTPVEEKEKKSKFTIRCCVMKFLNLTQLTST